MNNKIVILDDSVILYQHYMSDEAWESVMAFPRGGLTYLIKNNNIKFYAYVDYFYRNCLMTMDLPIYIVDEELGIDGEYDDIQEITEILDRIFPSANGEDIDLTPYLKKREAAETYQPIGDYLSREDADTLYQPIGDYLSANSLVGYATEQWVENKGYIDKIKTINNQSLIGEGNIEISGGTADAYTKAEADERFQPIGDYVSRTTFITYISNLTQQIESLQEAIEECCTGSGETLYRWITLTGPNDYICSGTTKYAKEQKQQSTDNGATWQNVSPAEYRAGILIETDSPDCGYEPVIEYRWVTVSGEYVCSGTTKYNKEKKQYRVDGGAWTDTSPLQTRRGSTVIETQSPDCGYVPPQYRWWQAPASDYICSGTTKYYKEYYQVSYDGGNTWQNVSPEQTRRGAVIESQSTDCGYVPTLGKYRLTLKDSTVITATCDYTSAITSGEVSTQYRTTLKSAEIGSCNTIIDNECFSLCSGMTSVTIPDSITIIGNEAFRQCYGLTSVTIPNSVQRINISAFITCKGLTGITIPSSVKYVGQNAFANCDNLTSVIIDSGVTSIDSWAFYRCRNLTSITVNATTPPEIGDGVFDSTNNCPIYVPCQSVAAYKTAWADYSSRIRCETEPQYRWHQAPATDYICSGTTKYYKEYYQVSYDGGSTWQNVSPEQTRRGSVIEYQSTDCGYIPAPKLTVVDTNNRTKTINCDGSPELTRQEVPGYTSIKTAVVGDCVTSLYETFWGETYLSGVTLPNTLETIGRAAFEDCTNLTGITIPDSVKYLGSGMGGGAFANSGLKSIVLPKVRYLYGGSFAGCTSLSSVTFGTQSYISFDISDFSGCTSLTSINITPDVYQLGGNTFKGCTNLQSITFSGLKQVPYIKSLAGGTYETFDDTNNCPIYVPANLLSDIKSADGWKQYKDRIQAIP